MCEMNRLDDGGWFKFIAMYVRRLYTCDTQWGATVVLFKNGVCD